MKECELIKGGHIFGLLAVNVVNKSSLYKTEKSVQSNQEGNSPTRPYQELKGPRFAAACRRLIFPLLNRRHLHAGKSKGGFSRYHYSVYRNSLMPILSFFLQGEMYKTC